MIKRILKFVIVGILRVEARAVLRKYKPGVIAVTGSVGKTATKDAIHAVLARRYHAGKSGKSYNSDVGLPLAVLGAESGWNNPFRWIKVFLRGLDLIFLKNIYPLRLVLEAGVDRPGDMERIARLIETDAVVFTKFSALPVHVEFFSSPEAVYEEKWKLVSSLKQTGVVIINGDDSELRARRGSLEQRRVVTYGLGEGNDLRATHINVLYEGDRKFPSGMSFKLDHEGHTVPVKMRGVIGEASVYVALAAAAAGVSQNMNLVEIIEGLEDYTPPPGRLRVLEGIRGSVILDDSYNSSPDALSHALSVLEKMETQGKKIAVIGDMLELGKYTEEAHRDVVSSLPSDTGLLVLVGPRARFARESAERRLGKRKVVHFQDAESAGAYLAKKMGEGDTALFKASQRIRLERAIRRVLKNPEHQKLLVRQGPEWEKR